MAGPVLVQGATGPNSAIINGAFDVAERPENEPPVYRRADGSDCWLYIDIGSTGKVGGGATRTLTTSPGVCCWPGELAFAGPQRSL